MEIRFYVMGSERKAFATVVGDLIGWEPVYKKAPTFAYAVGSYIIDKNGTLIFSDDADMGEAAQLLSALAEHGYVSSDSLPTAVSLGGDTAEEDAAAPAEEPSDTGRPVDSPITAFPEQVHNAPDRLSIELPWEDFTEQSYHNLVRLVESKAGLICQSIGAEELVIQHDEERICFPWFAADSSPEEVRVYTQLVGALCKMAKEQQRVTATSREVENPKYAMRCFLLRLCFIGDEYAAARKLLLRNLSGNSSFKSGARRERPADNAANPADSAPTAECDDSVGDTPEAPETAPTGGDSALLEMLADAALTHEVNASFEVSAHE